MLAEMAGIVPGKMAASEVTRVAAIRELLDRGYGKATQPIAGDTGQPLRIDFRWADAKDNLFPEERTLPTIEATADTNGDAEPGPRFCWADGSPVK
jgi:hypothetical protein